MKNNRVIYVTIIIYIWQRYYIEYWYGDFVTQHANDQGPMTVNTFATCAVCAQHIGLEICKSGPSGATHWPKCSGRCIASHSSCVMLQLCATRCFNKVRENFAGDISKNWHSRYPSLVPFRAKYMAWSDNRNAGLCWSKIYSRICSPRLKRNEDSGDMQSLHKYLTSHYTLYARQFFVDGEFGFA